MEKIQVWKRLVPVNSISVSNKLNWDLNASLGE